MILAMAMGEPGPFLAQEVAAEPFQSLSHGHEQAYGRNSPLIMK